MAVAAVFAVAAVQAQDLSSQRGESQDLGGLFGEKLDHGGIIINPTPQLLEVVCTDVLDITNGVALKGDAKAFAEDINFLKQS